MLGRHQHRRHRKGTGASRTLASVAGEHFSAVIVLVGIELTHLDQRLMPLAESRVPLGLTVLLLIATVPVVAGIAVVATRRRASHRTDLDAGHRQVIEQVVTAAGNGGKSTAEACITAACNGLEVLLGDWVRWTFEEDPRSLGLARNGSFWSCRVGCDGRSLTVSTGVSFNSQDVMVLERLEEIVDLLLRIDGG